MAGGGVGEVVGDRFDLVDEVVEVIGEVWNLADDVWNLADEVRDLVNDVWDLVNEVWNLVDDVWNLVDEVRNLVDEVWNLVDDAWNIAYKPGNVAHEVDNYAKNDPEPHRGLPGGRAPPRRPTIIAAMTHLTTMLRERLGLADPVPVDVQRGDIEAFDGFDRERVEYRGLEGDTIPAFLFTPNSRETRGGVVVFHQHNGEFHFGKSEVAGDVGSAFQAFGPALARRGLAVLAPDALTFEDRRGAVRGVEPDHYDWLQHYNAMTYRLLDGDVLMRKCLDDAQRAVSVLLQVPRVDAQRVGVAGHSYGGYTALYHAAVDARCRFACISGAVCSFETRRRENTGLTLFEAVPGLARLIDTHDVLAAIGPRPTLVVSGTGDKYSRDADEVVAKVAGDFITELRVERGHALDQERFDGIVEWVVGRVSR